MITITDNISPELLKAIEAEALSHIKYDPSDIRLHIDYYLKDTYKIYIKKRTRWLEPVYSNTLAFYANCPDYKLTRRRYFLQTYGDHFNCLVLSNKLLRHLYNEYIDTPYYMSQVCRIYKARHFPKPTVGCQALIFHSEKQYQLFKLRYSEYL